MNKEELIQELESIGYVKIAYNITEAYESRLYNWYKSPDSVCFHKNRRDINGMWNFRYIDSRFDRWDVIEGWVALEEGIDLYSLMVLYKDVML